MALQHVPKINYYDLTVHSNNTNLLILIYNDTNLIHKDTLNLNVLIRLRGILQYDAACAHKKLLTCLCFIYTVY